MTPQHARLQHCCMWAAVASAIKIFYVLLCLQKDMTRCTTLVTWGNICWSAVQQSDQTRSPDGHALQNIGLLLQNVMYYHEKIKDQLQHVHSHYAEACVKTQGLSWGGKKMAMCCVGEKHVPAVGMLAPYWFACYEPCQNTHNLLKWGFNRTLWPRTSLSLRRACLCCKQRREQLQYTLCRHNTVHTLCLQPACLFISEDLISWSHSLWNTWNNAATSSRVSVVNERIHMRSN